MINTRMKDALRRLGVASGGPMRTLSPRLQDLSRSDIIQLGGCTFLERLLPQPFDISRALAASFDRTELECSVNAIRVAQFLDQSDARSLSSLLEQGVLLACALRVRLKQYGRFTIILGFEAPELTEEAEFVSCTVRFHTNRPDEVPYMTPNLEGYQDAVLVLATEGPVDAAISGRCASVGV